MPDTPPTDVSREVLPALAPPWFVGAWRRRSIVVPGGEPIEPCEAWWLQSDSVFVDIRVVRSGHEDNQLPYSSTRAFAGRFEIVDGEVRWHLDLDSEGLAPRTDRAASSGLLISPDDPDLMIEDAPGRFREEWGRDAPLDSMVADSILADLIAADSMGARSREVVQTASVIGVRLGLVCGAVWRVGATTSGLIWKTTRQMAVIAAVGTALATRPPEIPAHWGWP